MIFQKLLSKFQLTSKPGQVYVASSLLNADAAKITMNNFRNLGFEITYDWTIHGRISPDQKELAAQVCAAEIAGVRGCDLFFMQFPARTGSHVELGIAFFTNVPIVIYWDGDDVPDKTFYAHPNIEMHHDYNQALSSAVAKLNRRVVSSKPIFERLKTWLQDIFHTN